MRQAWPKPERRRKSPPGFSVPVKQTISGRSHGMCELDFCGPADHYHHRAPRGRGGSSLPWVNLPANGLHVAARCHDHIESRREVALTNGWLVSRLRGLTAAEVPVLYRGRRVLLSDDGSVVPAGGES